MATIPGPPGMSDAVQPIPFVTAFPAVDSFSIANIPMPGRWILTDATREFGWQIQMGYGLSGAYVLPKGDPLVVAKFRGEFWATSDYKIYTEIRKRILQKGVISLGIIAAAMGITHPELAALGVTSVVTLKVHPTIDAGGGLWIAGLEFLQYRPPAPPPPKPKFVIPDAGVSKPTAQTAQQAELAKLRAETATLMGAL